MKIKQNWVFSILALASLLVGACKSGQRNTQTLLWSDEFNAQTVSNKKWNYDIGIGTGNNGWGNNELQYYTAGTKNAYIEDFDDGSRGLVIVARKENYKGRGYTSARLHTQGKHSWTHGRIEARMKLPQGQGLWPAFWMLGSNFNTVGWPACGEIDIMEYRGNIPSEVSSAIHWGNSFSEHKYLTSNYRLGGGKKFSDDFHIFAIEWNTDSVDWYVDGNLYSTRTHPSAAFNKPFFVLINMAVGGNFLENPPPNANYFPQKLYVDWVRVYSLEKL